MMNDLYPNFLFFIFFLGALYQLITTIKLPLTKYILMKKTIFIKIPDAGREQELLLNTSDTTTGKIIVLIFVSRKSIIN